MAKSLRSKRKKRLRTIRREIVAPLYDKKDEAKLKAQEAALNAPKLPVRMPKNAMADSMELIKDADSSKSMDVEMVDEGEDKSKSLLKPTGGIGKKKRQQLKKDKRHRRGKIRRKKI